MNQMIIEQLQRIEDKLDILLEALADHGDDDESEELTLDGMPAGRERAAGTPL